MVFDLRKHIWEISWDVANTEPTWQQHLWLVFSTASHSRTEQLQPEDPSPRSQFADLYIARATTFFVSCLQPRLPPHSFTAIFFTFFPLKKLDGNTTNWHSQSFANFQKIHFTLRWKPGCWRLFKKRGVFLRGKKPGAHADNPLRVCLRGHVSACFIQFTLIWSHLILVPSTVCSPQTVCQMLCFMFAAQSHRDDTGKGTGQMRCGCHLAGLVISTHDIVLSSSHTHTHVSLILHRGVGGVCLMSDRISAASWHILRYSSPIP